MNRLLKDTIRRLEEQLKSAKELQSRVKLTKKPPAQQDVKKIVDNIRSIEQQTQQRYVEATEQPTELDEEMDEDEDTEMSAVAVGALAVVGVVTKVTPTTDAGAADEDYVPPPAEEADDDGGEEDVVLPPSSRKRQRRDTDSADAPFKEKAVENRIKAIKGRAKGADGKPHANPFTHLKNAGDYFVQTDAPIERPDDAAEEKILTKGSKMDFYSTVVPSPTATANPIIDALARNNFNAAKTIPCWLQDNLASSTSFGKIAEDYRKMQEHLKNKNAGLKMAISIFSELEKGTAAVHDFTANKDEIKDVKASLVRDVGDKKPAKETLKNAMGCATSKHSKALVEAVFNAATAKK